MEAHGLAYAENGETRFSNLEFRLERTDKVAILAESEPAVTDFLQIIAGEKEPTAGEYKWGGTTSMSYFPKDNSAFFDGVELNLIEWLRQFSPTEDTETFLRGFLGRMLFSGDEVFKSAKVLSGGERVRCMLSRMMLFGSNVLVLDQPTNHLDLESITALNDGLRDFKGVVIFASHDHEFIQTIANRILYLREDGLIDYRGTYDEFIEFMRGRGEHLQQ